MIRRSAILILCVAILGGLLAYRIRHKPAAPVALKPVVATQPAALPAIRRAAKPVYPTYLQLVHTENPMVAATQPLDVPVELNDSAHIVLHDPVYLDPIGNLWITRKDGQPTEKALQKPAESEEHLITDQPVFVHWSPDDTGNWAAAVVVRAGKGYDLITKKDRRHLADDRPYQWSTAFSIMGKIVVTTDIGVSVFDVSPKSIAEHYHALPGCGPGGNPPVTMLDTRGILAWSPWENHRPGSSGILRFVDGKWTILPAADWPARPIQLSMLLDGSVLRMAAAAPSTPAAAKPAEGIADNDTPDSFPDQVQLSIGQLEPAQFDRRRVIDLINQLSDPDGEQRQAAFEELSRYGPAVAPLLEKAADDQSPEAKMRLTQLLGSKITPGLGGMMPVNNRLAVARRCSDGTVLFFAPAGVQIATERDEPELVNPAWLALRPDGRMERPLSATLVANQNPQSPTIFSLHDEWIRTDESGPGRLVVNRFEPILRPDEKQFTELVGIASRRRWVFRNASRDTLIIDPLIADPTPKLPAWKITVSSGFTGWDSADFPAVSRGDQTGPTGQAGNWELSTDGWKALPPPEKVITEKPPAAPTAGPTTAPSMGSPLLITADGIRYYDGKESIIQLKPGGAATTWPLPAAAVGSADPTLLQTRDGLLFLFNQGGRLLRIRPTPGEAEPFKLEATFTRDIPNTDHPARVWLDPAQRIDFVSDNNILTITFPSGTIPREISRMMLDEQN
jgi:hypothetical protein